MPKLVLQLNQFNSKNMTNNTAILDHSYAQLVVTIVWLILQRKNLSYCWESKSGNK